MSRSPDIAPSSSGSYNAGLVAPSPAVQNFLNVLKTRPQQPNDAQFFSENCAAFAQVLKNPTRNDQGKLEEISRNLNSVVNRYASDPECHAGCQEFKSVGDTLTPRIYAYVLLGSGSFKHERGSMLAVSQDLNEYIASHPATQQSTTPPSQNTLTQSDTPPAAPTTNAPTAPAPTTTPPAQNTGTGTDDDDDTKAKPPANGFVMLLQILCALLGGGADNSQSKDGPAAPEQNSFAGIVSHLFGSGVTSPQAPAATPTAPQTQGPAAQQTNVLG